MESESLEKLGPYDYLTGERVVYFNAGAITRRSVVLWPNGSVEERLYDENGHIQRRQQRDAAYWDAQVYT